MKEQTAKGTDLRAVLQSLAAPGQYPELVQVSVFEGIARLIDRNGSIIYEAPLQHLLRDSLALAWEYILWARP